MVKELNKETLKEALGSGKLFVIDLYADWCGPCKMLSPVIDELSEEMTEVGFGKINVDKEPEIASQFRVESIPMIALVKNNTFLDFSVGFKPKEELKKFIEEAK